MGRIPRAGGWDSGGWIARLSGGDQTPRTVRARRVVAAPSCSDWFVVRTGCSVWT